MVGSVVPRLAVGREVGLELDRRKLGVWTVLRRALLSSLFSRSLEKRVSFLGGRENDGMVWTGPGTYLVAEMSHSVNWKYKRIA